MSCLSCNIPVNSRYVYCFNCSQKTASCLICKKAINQRYKYCCDCLEKKREIVKPIRYFYERGNEYIYLDDKTGTFGKCVSFQKDMNYNYYHLFKGDEESEDGLIKFKAKFETWADELKTKGNINYRDFYNHASATEFIFKNLGHDIQSEQPNIYEYEFIENCNNGGLIYFNDELKNKKIKSYGFDYSSFYPHILVNRELKVPTKKGVRVKLDDLDYENLQYGIYRVKITTNNTEFKKVFGFSKHDTYTHFSIAFAYKHREQFNINFELNSEAKYNALIYEDSCLKPSIDIFFNWFDKLNKLKKQCPDNRLLKHVFSSLWGSLCALDITYFHDDDIYSEGEENQYTRINEKMYLKGGEIHTRLDCIKNAKPYKFHYGRMKPFIISLARLELGNLILSTNIIDNVFRCQTDNVVLNIPFDFATLGYSYYPKPEDKTSGLIKWKGVNTYFHICKTCKKEYKYSEPHFCDAS